MQDDELRRADEDERDRLSRFSQASLRINESLDLDVVLREVVDGARALTGARWGGVTALDDAGQLEDFITSGLTPEEHRLFLELPGGPAFFQYLSSLPEPLRLADFSGHTRSLGLPDIDPPLGPVHSFLGAPIRHLGRQVGNLYLSDKEAGREFTQDDEEVLVLFASQAALVISNARRHREVEQARADLDVLVNTAPVGVVVFDARKGEPLSLNREARRILSVLCEPGGSVEELLDVLTFLRGDGRETSLEEFPLAQALSTGEFVRAEEIGIRVPDGRSINTLVNATPITSGDGSVASVVVTLQDMAPLEEVDRLRAEFLTVMGQELITPLTSIKGAAATLLETPDALDPAVARHFYQVIGSQADHMRGVIGDLMDVARIETGTLSVNAEPLEVYALVAEARSVFVAAGGRCSVQVDLPDGLPRVMADRRLVVQVLSNLLSDAARRCSDAFPIRVGAVQDALHVALSVAYEARGVQSERLADLFLRYSRLEGEGGDAAGSGLGLAICKGLVEAHGGRIWAESAGAGLGARFTFTLPVVQDVAVGIVGGALPRPSLRSRPRERERILVLEADPRLLRYARDTLVQAGYEPTVTSDPDEVPRLLKSSSPHLALMDMTLPEVDGVELMRRVPGLAALPVIFLCGYGQDDLMSRAFDMGASDYVVKPFSPTELVARVRVALRRRVVPSQGELLEPYVLGDLSIDYSERTAAVAGDVVQLTAAEYGVLFELSVSTGRVVTYQQLLQRIWGPGSYEDLRPLRSVMRRLRRKLGDDAGDPAYIFTHPRVGYRMGRTEDRDGASP